MLLKLKFKCIFSFLLLSKNLRDFEILQQLLFKVYVYFMSMTVLPSHICTVCVPGAYTSQRRATDLWRDRLL